MDLVWKIRTQVNYQFLFDFHVFDISCSWFIFVGRGVMPSVKLALDHVNEHSEILANYRLHMWWNDTEVVISSWIFNLLCAGMHLSKFN